MRLSIYFKIKSKSSALARLLLTAEVFRLRQSYITRQFCRCRWQKPFGGHMAHEGAFRAGSYTGEAPSCCRFRPRENALPGLGISLALRSSLFSWLIVFRRCSVRPSVVRESRWSRWPIRSGCEGGRSQSGRLAGAFQWLLHITTQTPARRKANPCEVLEKACRFPRSMDHGAKQSFRVACRCWNDHRKDRGETLFFHLPESASVRLIEKADF